MEGKPIGRQLQWLSEQLCCSKRDEDLDRFYHLLRRLEKGLGGKRLLRGCEGGPEWPQRGVYFFFEPNEYRLCRDEQRVVRVGTVGVSLGSKATLWSRIRTHRGTRNGGGNHHGSVFRRHVGDALARKDKSLFVPGWGEGKSANKETRKLEAPLEKAVSDYIAEMSILWLDVEDEPGPASHRAYLERNLIGLLAGGDLGPTDPPSHEWLGRSSPEKRIKNSGLWNLGFIDYPYSPSFLDILEEYVSVTIEKKEPPR